MGLENTPGWMTLVMHDRQLSWAATRQWTESWSWKCVYPVVPSKCWLLNSTARSTRYVHSTTWRPRYTQRKLTLLTLFIKLHGNIVCIRKIIIGLSLPQDWRIF